MNCEICGSETHGIEVKIDGSDFIVCNGCSKHGRIKQEPVRSTTPKRKLLFKQTNISMPMLIRNYGKTIKQAREKLGLTHEELGQKLFEKSSIIQKLETQNAKPESGLIKKLEKELAISLTEEINEVEIEQQEQGGRRTLLDIYEKSKKKK